jgi:hypothetical protein
VSGESIGEAFEVLEHLGRIISWESISEAFEVLEHRLDRKTLLFTTDSKSTVRAIF